MISEARAAARNTDLHRDVTDVADVDVPGGDVGVQPERVAQTLGPHVVILRRKREVSGIVHHCVRGDPDEMPLWKKTSNKQTNKKSGRITQLINTTCSGCNTVR